MNRDIILSALQSFRCRYYGDNISLATLLEPIDPRGRELVALADYIDDTLTNLDRFRE